MQLPFTRTEFLRVFAEYNSDLWPVAVLLWVASVVAAVSIVRGGTSHRAVSALLAGHWAWSGVAYHAAYFTAINPAAWLFAAAFVAQAIVFLHRGVVRGEIRYAFGREPRHRIAVALIVYSLVYPALSEFDVAFESASSSTSAGLAIGAPLFGVPCPTTLFTAGLLLTVRPLRPMLFLIPAAWSCIGGSAALLLGVRADIALFAAAFALALFAVTSRRPQPVGT